jgi:hypothetical protein
MRQKAEWRGFYSLVPWDSSTTPNVRLVWWNQAKFSHDRKIDLPGRIYPEMTLLTAASSSEDNVTEYSRMDSPSG